METGFRKEGKAGEGEWEGRRMRCERRGEEGGRRTRRRKRKTQGEEK